MQRRTAHAMGAALVVVFLVGGGGLRWTRYDDDIDVPDWLLARHTGSPAFGDLDLSA